MDMDLVNQKKIEDTWDFQAELIKAGLPSALAKACIDYHDYMLGLRNGQIIIFKEAKHTIGSKYVHLIDCTLEVQDSDDQQFERGMDLLLSEIAWVADSPNGT